MPRSLYVTLRSPRAVRDFFVSCVADFANSHVAVQSKTRERMVAVDRNFVVTYFNDCDHLLLTVWERESKRVSRSEK